MKALILAGGQGSRMGPIGQGMPKCLLPAGRHTVLQRQLAHCAAAGAEAAVLALGLRLAPMIEQHLALSELPLPVRVQVEAHSLGTAAALTQALQGWQGPCLLLLGDMIWADAELVPRLAAAGRHGGADLWLAVTGGCEPQSIECNVELGPQTADPTQVLRILEKPAPHELRSAHRWACCAYLSPRAVEQVARVHTQAQGAHIGHLLEALREGLRTLAVANQAPEFNLNRIEDWWAAHEQLRLADLKTTTS